MKKAINHVAIIMDGNGRWAKEKFRPRVWGHIRGSNIVTSIVEKASDINLDALTLYAFSTENWSRPEKEVSTLFKLLKKFLIRERDSIKRNNIQFQVIGNIQGLNKETQNLIKELENESKENTGLKLSFAFSYGGRAEIVDSVNTFIRKNPNCEITEESLESYLYRPDTGNVDLMIRTGGDKRISNYLLWQMSYAELFFTDTKWPDFTTIEFEKIINQVSCRDRRFGSLDNAGSFDKTRELVKEKK